MAKFVVEYHIHLGDLVRFYLGNGVMQQGIVQDISQMPDIFVEGNKDGVYRRWRRSIEELDILWSEHEDYGIEHKLVIGDDEAVEFVHGGLVGEERFKEKTYFDKKHNKIS